VVIIATVKFSALNALVAAVEEGSLRAAARRVGVSQPALTKMVRELERELSATLLTRSTTGVFATAQGKVLYDRARAAARELEQAVEQIDQLGGKMTGELSIGAVPLAVLLLIPEALRTFGREFPQIRMRIREELYIAELTSLRLGGIDMALGPIPGGLPAGEFHVEELMPIEMSVVARKGSEWLRCRSLSQLVGARWVYTSLSGATGYVRLLFERHDLPAPPAAAVVNSTLGLIALIGSGDYVGLLPTPIASHAAAELFLTRLPIREGPLELRLGAIVKTDSLLKPSVRHFISHLHRATHQVVKTASSASALSANP
jgi:DNA-binding transcriptional LysR family regulator